MRLFYALWPDAEFQDALGRWAAECQDACGGRRIATQKLHVTVAFLGEVAAQRYATLLEIAASIHASAFELVFDRVGHWRHNGIVYAAPRDTPEALRTLVRGLTERLGDAGFRTEAREHAPHVTLLRDVRRRPRRAGYPPLAWRVEALTLVETLRRDGKPVYEMRERWTLSG